MNGLRRDTEHTGQAHRKRPKVPWWSPPTTTLNTQYAATNTTECDKPPPTEPWNIDTNTDAGDEPPPF